MKMVITGYSELITPEINIITVRHKFGVVSVAKSKMITFWKFSKFCFYCEIIAKWVRASAKCKTQNFGIT